MSELSAKMRLAEGNRLMYWCDGCRCLHTVQYGDGGGPRWTWNGDANNPTFSPSVLVRSGHYADHAGMTAADCWICNNPEESHFKCTICHTFVRDGRVEYLNDCTHHLAGQTVDLPDLPHHLRD